MGLVRALVLLVGVLLASACTAPRLVEDQASPTPLPPPPESNKPVFVAKRGAVVETLRGNGRIAPVQEAILYFEQSGRLKRLKAELNQKVKRGDVLAELETGDLGTRVAQARIQMEIAQLGLERAVAAANAGSPEVKTAAAKIVQAEAGLGQALAALERARTGSTAADMRAADAGIAAAQAAVEKAQADLARLQTPKSAAETAAARASLDKAASVVQQAQAAYDRIASRPDAAGRPEGVTLMQATADYEAAKARLQLALAGPKPEELRAAQENVNAARGALESANARRLQVAAGPLPQDVSSAEASLTAASANVEAARAEYDAKVTAAAVGQANFDVQVAEKQVNLASVTLRTLEEQLTRSVIKAPFDGIVTSTTGREGDPVGAFAPVVQVADPSELRIAIDFNAPDMAKLAVGQPVTITTDAFKGQRFESKVASLPSVAAGIPQTTAGGQQRPGARSTLIDFKPPGPVDLGSLANVTIATQRKEDVVLVPNQAVRKAGGRVYVQVDAGGGRKREVDVQVGIATELETEIVRGIKEGTRVVSQ